MEFGGKSYNDKKEVQLYGLGISNKKEVKFFGKEKRKHNRRLLKREKRQFKKNQETRTIHDEAPKEASR